jgi:integrase
VKNHLTQKDVVGSIRAGVHTEIRDGRSKGLVLRIHGPDKWEWSIRRSKNGRDYRFNLGNEWSLDEARELLVQFDLQCRHRYDTPFRDDAPWHDFLAKRKASKLGIDVAPRRKTVAEETPAPLSPKSMSWKEGAELWLAEVGRIRRQSTVDAYKGALNVLELKPFASRQVCEITIEEMAEAVTTIARRGKERQAETSAIAIRGFFRFLGADGMRNQTGVAKRAMEDLESPERSMDEGDDDGSNNLRVPVDDDIARIWAWLEIEASAPERDRLAGKLLIYSVQRRRAVALARVADFEPAGVLGGLWKMPPLHRKTASIRARRGLDPGAHVVPLPPAAWAIFKQAKALAGGSEYLFPAARNRKKSKPAATIHPSRLTHMLAEIPGNDCTPHSLRRAFGTTFAGAAKLKLSDVKLILDHSEGIKSGDVTAEHYSFLSGMHEKWPVMVGWCEFVDAAAKRGVI